jgi:isoleucyl-tRNA synthetase
MLVGMVALAVDPDADYALVELAGEEGAPSEQLLLAERAVKDTLTGEFRYVRRIRGRALADVQYHPPFTYVPSSRGVGKVVLSRQVPPDRGTGLLAVMPGFDDLSLALARASDLPIPDLLDDRGYLGNAVVRWRGLSPLVAEKYLIENLRERGLLFREEVGSEARSLCPYCDTPLLPLIRDVWQVPAQRGPWIIGRDRAWGVPLPVWCCQRCGEQTCVAGLDELAHRTGLDPMKIEPHRPAIDGLTLPCHACGGSMRRVEAVVDAAFEAAVLSLSSWPSPALHDPASQAAAVTDDQEEVQGMVVTLGDPDLGWIGDLENTATLMQWPRGWRQAVSVEEDGREADGERERDDGPGAPADTQRWAVYTGVTPALAEGGFLLPVWRLAMDLVTGADHDQKQGKERPTGDALLDQWLMACLHESTWIVTRALDAGDAQRAAETVTRLLGDLSLWHRLSEGRGHRVAASVLSQLLAPFVPHLAEAVHRRLTKGTGQSVHLGNWPLPDPDWAEPRLVAGMSEVRELARLGETARLRAGIELERPLRQALVSMTGDPAGAEALAPFQTLLAQLLGAAQVRFGPDAGAQITWHLDLATEQAVQRSVPTVEIRAALASLAPENAANLAAQLGEGLSVGLTVDDRAITLLPDEVVVTMQAKPGWIAAAGEKRLVALEVA